jgi:phosphatidylserine/phosphatidylglycerophosphate/cardiolipin synthase-like enzyme
LPITYGIGNSNLIVTPQANNQAILHAIATATSSLDLVIYGLTDKQILRALIKAKLQGKNLHILLQEAPYRSPDENSYAIKLLQDAKISYAINRSTANLLHQKTLIIDNNSVLLLTANLTAAAFTKQRNFGLLIQQPELVAEIKQIFAADWHNRHFKPQQAALVWSPDNSRTKINSLLSQAKQVINIYAAELHDRQILSNLSLAAQRGVIVKIITSNKLSMFKLRSYPELKVRYSTKLFIHAKVIIVDRSLALLGSINLTGQSLDHNRELSILIADPIIVENLLNYFAQDWAAAQYKIS